MGHFVSALCVFKIVWYQVKQSVFILHEVLFLLCGAVFECCLFLPCVIFELCVYVGACCWCVVDFIFLRNCVFRASIPSAFQNIALLFFVAFHGFRCVFMYDLWCWLSCQFVQSICQLTVVAIFKCDILKCVVLIYCFGCFIGFERMSLL